MTRIALTIAGSDPGGGAGLQADLKTFHEFGVFGTSVVTLITVQNTVRTSRVEMLDANLVGEQFDAVLEDLTPHAIKTGALGSAAIVEAIAARAFSCPLVIDPVTLGKHGAPLLNSDARAALRRLLIPRAHLITPNLDEAAELAGIVVRDLASMRDAAKRIADLGVQSVLVNRRTLASGSFHRVLLAAVRIEAYPWNRLHLLRRDHGRPCAGRATSRRRASRESLYR